MNLNLDTQMQANELRIGNLLMDVSGHVGYVTQINEDKTVKIRTNEGVLITWMRADLFQPIPLTEEILLKCGFEYDELNYFYSLYYNNFKLEFHFDEQYEFWLNDISMEVKYLHQLQNLYFALTGKELDIDL